MKIRLMLAIAAVAVVAALSGSEAQAQTVRTNINLRRASQYPWHGGYAHTSWGQPVALVVPPTAHLQSKWSWGVANTEIARIPHQFGRAWPGPYAGGYGFSARRTGPVTLTSLASITFAALGSCESYATPRTAGENSAFLCLVCFNPSVMSRASRPSAVHGSTY